MTKITQNQSGIEVICGPMFSGKTEELIRRYKLYSYANIETITFKPKIDNRWSQHKIVSRAGSKIPTYSVSSIEDVKKILKQNFYRNPEVIFFDEVQFFDNSFVEFIEFLAKNGKHIIVAGLDTNFKGEPFSTTMKLLGYADDVKKLYAICNKCKQIATRTQKLVGNEPASIDSDTIEIGDIESYEPRCRKCHTVKENDQTTNSIDLNLILMQNI